MENKRMKEQMEKQAEEEKKKKLEEDKIMGSESILNIPGEDMPSFSLNITQMIQEIQRGRASEEEIQEHTPPQKQSSKEAVLETSKGTIERGVKERKRAERDRDDSDFVYPKQKKKKKMKILFHSLRLRVLPLVSATKRFPLLSKNLEN